MNLFSKIFKGKKTIDKTEQSKRIEDFYDSCIYELGNIITLSYIISKSKIILARPETEQKAYLKLREINNILRKFDEGQIEADVKTIVLYFKIVFPDLYIVFYKEADGNITKICNSIQQYYYKELDIINKANQAANVGDEQAAPIATQVADNNDPKE